MDVHQNTFQVMQQKTETDGEIESWIYEQARIDDDDIVAMYNRPTTMIWEVNLAYATAYKNRAKWHRPKGKA